MLDSSEPAEAARAAIIAAKSILSSGTNGSPQVIARAKQLVAMGEVALAEQISSLRRSTSSELGMAADAPPEAAVEAQSLPRSPAEQKPDYAAPRPRPPRGSVQDDVMLGFYRDTLIVEMPMLRGELRGKAEQPLRDLRVEVSGSRAMISATDFQGYRTGRLIVATRPIPETPLWRVTTAGADRVSVQIPGFKTWAGPDATVTVAPLILIGVPRPVKSSAEDLQSPQPDAEGEVAPRHAASVGPAPSTPSAPPQGRQHKG